MLNLQFNQPAADLTLDAHEVQGVVLVRHVVFEVVVPKLLNIGDLFAEFPLALEKAIVMEISYSTPSSMVSWICAACMPVMVALCWPRITDAPVLNPMASTS